MQAWTKSSFLTGETGAYVEKSRRIFVLEFKPKNACKINFEGEVYYLPASEIYFDPECQYILEKEE